MNGWLGIIGSNKFFFNFSFGRQSALSASIFPMKNREGFLATITAASYTSQKGNYYID
jgi:hypothetical protein